MTSIYKKKKHLYLGNLVGLLLCLRAWLVLRGARVDVRVVRIHEPRGWVTAPSKGWGGVNSLTVVRFGLCLGVFVLFKQGFKLPSSNQPCSLMLLA